jgi:hypothetical protein
MTLRQNKINQKQNKIVNKVELNGVVVILSPDGTGKPEPIENEGIMETCEHWTLGVHRECYVSESDDSLDLNDRVFY